MGAGDVEQALPGLALLERLQLGAHLVLAQELDQLLGHLPIRVLALQAADLGAHGGVVAGIVELPQRAHVDGAGRREQVGGRLPARVRRLQPRDLLLDARAVAAARMVAQGALVDAVGQLAAGAAAQPYLHAFLQRLREARRTVLLGVRRRQEAQRGQHGQQRSGPEQG